MVFGFYIFLNLFSPLNYSLSKMHTFSKYFKCTLPLYLFFYWILFLFDSKDTISCIHVNYKYTQSKYFLWTERFIFEVLPSYFLIVKWTLLMIKFWKMLFHFSINEAKAIHSKTIRQQQQIKEKTIFWRKNKNH